MSKILLKNKDLLLKTWDTSNLSNQQLKDAYRLFTKYYNQVPFKRFKQDIRLNDRMLGVVDKHKHNLHAFMCMRELDFKYHDKYIKLFCGGKTIAEKLYWGSPIISKLILRWIKFAAIYRFKHPFSSVFIFYPATGYKTYLLIANNVFNYWPCYSKKNNELKEIAFIASKTLYNGDFDETTMLVDFSKDYALQQSTAPITRALKKNPKVSHFVKMNPHWEHGKGIPTIANFNFTAVTLAIFRQFRKIIRQFHRAY